MTSQAASRSAAGAAGAGPAAARDASDADRSATHASRLPLARFTGLSYPPSAETKGPRGGPFARTASKDGSVRAVLDEEAVVAERDRVVRVAVEAVRERGVRGRVRPHLL